VFWCARCVQLNTSAALLASCCAFSAYTVRGFQPSVQFAAEVNIRCGYAIPAALRALPTRMLCHTVTKTVLRSAAGT
jgi:hypothetical protein